MSDSKSILEQKLQDIIDAHLSPERLRKLQKRYEAGDLTIAELAQKVNVPPCLVYAAVTPVRIQTAYKIKSLNIESKIFMYVRQGITPLKIARLLRQPLTEVLLHTKNVYTQYAYMERPWYLLKHPKERTDWSDYEFEPDSIPPAVQINAADGDFQGIPKRRCSRCNTLNYIPDIRTLCFACRVRDIKETGKIPSAPEDTSEDDESDPFKRHYKKFEESKRA